jgi:hypothetical protein
VWLAQFDENEWPFTAHSLLQRYNTGNFETTWKARLATKAVFSELWNTEKLSGNFGHSAANAVPVVQILPRWILVACQWQ